MFCTIWKPFKAFHDGGRPLSRADWKFRDNRFPLLFDVVFDRIAVMYGSQTGNAHSIAERVYEECKRRGFNVTLLACDGWKKVTMGMVLSNLMSEYCRGFERENKQIWLEIG